MESIFIYHDFLIFFKVVCNWDQCVHPKLKMLCTNSAEEYLIALFKDKKQFYYISCKYDYYLNRLLVVIFIYKEHLKFILL